jgi:hypothetical protein
MTIPEWLAALICLACSVPVIASYLAAHDARERARKRIQRDPWTLRKD